MEAKDVRILPWKKVTDWSELSASNRSIIFGVDEVCKSDVDIFVKNIYKDIARKLNIPFDQLEPILMEENEAFHTLNSKIFKEYESWAKNDQLLIELQNTLRVPDITNIVDNVSLCLKLYERLSDIEKMAFLQKIGKINVRIEHHPVQVEEITVE